MKQWSFGNGEKTVAMVKLNLSSFEGVRKLVK